MRKSYYLSLFFFKEEGGGGDNNVQVERTEWNGSQRKIEKESLLIFNGREITLGARCTQLDFSFAPMSIKVTDVDKRLHPFWSSMRLHEFCDTLSFFFLMTHGRVYDSQQKHVTLRC